MKNFKINYIFQDINTIYPVFYWPSLFSYYEKRTIITTLLKEPVAPSKPRGFSSLFGYSKEYQEELKSYNFEKKKYDEHERKRSILWQEYNNFKEYQELHKLNLKEIIRTAIPASINYPNPIVGRLEAQFEVYLKSKFKKKIFTNRIIELNENGHNYIPDFILYDKDTNINIDIEIDEPYVLKTGKPTHYLYKTNEFQKSIDTYRDLWFTERGWFVIRFSEQQIYTAPEKCLIFIESLFSSLKTLVNENLFTIPNFEIETDKRWTIQDSLELYKKRHREKLHNIEIPISHEPLLDERDLLILKRMNPSLFLNEEDEMPF